MWKIQRGKSGDERERSFSWNKVIALELVALAVIVIWNLTLIRSGPQTVYGQEKTSASLSAQMGQHSAAPEREFVLSDLPAMITSPQRVIVMPAPRTGLSAAHYKTLKQLALQRGGIGEAAEPPAAPDLTTPGLKTAIFLPNSAQESACGFAIPSDMALAASPTHVVQVTNSCIEVINAATGVRFTGFPKTLNTFFGAAGAIGDPRALYDRQNNRFIVIAENFTTNELKLAASATSNPTGTWRIFTLSMGISGGFCGDFPTLGQTLQENGDAKGGIYVGFNRFSCSNDAFVDNMVWILPKTPIYSGAGFTFFFFNNFNLGGVSLDTLQPANVSATGDRPRSEFLVNSKDFNFGGGGCFNGCNGLVVWAINNGVPSPNTSPSLNGVAIATANNYFFPSDAPQPGCAAGPCLIDKGTTNITGLVNYTSGSVYGSLNSSKGVLWFEIHPTLNEAGAISAAVLRNEQCFACGGFSGGGHAYYATIVPDTEGNFTMVYNFSAPDAFPGTAFLSRRVTQAHNTVPDNGIFLASGQAFYQQLDQFGRNRWGDYTAGHKAFEALNAQWFAGEFSQSNGNWGTAIGKNGYTLLTQP
jgi:hypothetical protein